MMSLKFKCAKNAKYIAKTFLSGLLFSVVLFSTTYNFLGFFIYPRLILAIIGFNYLVWHHDARKLLAPPGFIFLSVPFIFLSAFINDEWRDFGVLLMLIIRSVVVSYFAVVGIFFFLKKIASKYTYNFMVDAICFAVSIQLIITFLQLANINFRNEFLKIVNLSDSWRAMADLGLPRFSGIGGISIYDTAISYCVLASIFLINKPRSKIQSWIWAGAIFFVVMLCLLHGRTGFFYSIVLILMIVSKDVFYEKNHFFIGTKIFVLSGVFGGFGYFFMDEALRELVLNFSGELILNFLAGEGIRSDSTDDFLENHLNFPAIDTILGGSAYWAQPELSDSKNNQYSTDSGFLLLLNYGGIPLLFSFLLGIFGAIIVLYKFNLPKLIGKHKKLFLVYLLLMFFIVGVKGPIFLSEHYMTALFLIILVYSESFKLKKSEV